MLRDQCLTCQWRDESDGRGCGEPGRAAAKATGAGSAPGGPSRIPSPAGVLPPRARNPLSLRGFGLAGAGKRNRLVAAAVGAVCRNEWPAAVDRGRSRRYGPRPRRHARRPMGRSQVVRQRILIPPFPGSSPGAPASKSRLMGHVRLQKSAGLSRKLAKRYGVSEAFR